MDDIRVYKNALSPSDIKQLYDLERVSELPEEFSGVALWLDSSNVDGKNNSSLSDGDYVDVWTDLSGLGHHAVQSSSSARPLFANSAIEFDGVDDYLKSPLKIRTAQCMSSWCTSWYRLVTQPCSLATTRQQRPPSWDSQQARREAGFGYALAPMVTNLPPCFGGRKGRRELSPLRRRLLQVGEFRELRIDGSRQVQAGLATLNPNSGQETIIRGHEPLCQGTAQGGHLFRECPEFRKGCSLTRPTLLKSGVWGVLLTTVMGLQMRLKN